MTFKSHIQRDGTLYLGPDASEAGYRPGAAVEVIRTRAGSLILVIDSTPPTIPAKFLPLPKDRVAIGAERLP